MQTSKIKSKFIIIEGIDRVGKDTQQNLIMKNFPKIVFHKFHYSSLPFKNDVSIHRAYSGNMYEEMFEIMKSFKEGQISAIFNRSHLGESVYAPLYRGYSGDFIFKIEESGIKSLDNELYLITLINDPHIVWERDDGLGLHTTEEDISAEVEGFKRAHRKSKIKNKLLINVGSMTPDEVNKIIINFIHEADSLNKEELKLKTF